ncbi:MAG: hypothetical protein ACRDU8_03930 [Egibacteraceae bacterium]
MPKTVAQGWEVYARQRRARQASNTLSDLGWAYFVREVPRQLNRHKLHMTFTVNTPELMREFVTRAGLECVDTVTDVVRRDCITLIRKPH